MKAMRLSLLVACTAFLVLAAFSSRSDARVSVGIGINIPAYTFAAPPPVVVIPGTYVYFVPEANIEILFYHGFWYRPYEGHWYRARGYNGPRAYISPARVPREVIELPPNYRQAYRDHPRIGYQDFNRHWRGWERNRYWEKDERWREGRGHERHKERMGHGGGERHMREHDERG